MKDLIQTIINNITGSVKTTILGIIILIVGIVSLFYTELGAGTVPSVELIVLGVVVACLKDPKKTDTCDNQKKGGGNNLPMIAILIAVLVSGCATERRCAEKFSTSSTSDSSIVEIREIVRDTVIYVPSDSAVIYVPNPCDSLGNLKPSIFQSTGEKGRSNATVLISDKGIKVDCDCTEEYHVIKKMQREIDRLHSRKSETITVYKQKESFWQKLGVGVTIFIVSYLLGALRIHSLIFKR